MIPEGYEDLFSKHEPDPLLRELDGCILWYYVPVDSNDPRGRMWSMAPFDAAAEIKRLREALRKIAEWDLTGTAMAALGEEK